MSSYDYQNEIGVNLDNVFKNIQNKKENEQVISSLKKHFKSELIKLTTVDDTTFLLFPKQKIIVFPNNFILKEKAMLNMIYAAEKYHLSLYDMLNFSTVKVPKAIIKWIEENVGTGVSNG